MKKESILKNISSHDLSLLQKKPQPHFIKPMLATLTHSYFSNAEWLFEEKFDGVRCLVFKKKDEVRLVSRNNNMMNAQYPEIVEALQKQQADNFIIDGEIVAMNKEGVTDFQLLQSRINFINRSGSKTLNPIYYRIFDILYVDGYDVQKLPLLVRKKILKKLLKYNKILIFTSFIIDQGIGFFKKACSLHWEGVIAKKSNSTYVNVRSRDWLKFKCSDSQELVIGGFTQPRGSRLHFGALLVGYYENGTLKYAGKVGTGFSFETLQFLGFKLNKLERKTCPFVDYCESTLDIHWVKPVLVANFEFAQWTRAGKLRVGRYKGLRTDKKAKNVVREG